MLEMIDPSKKTPPHLEEESSKSDDSDAFELGDSDSDLDPPSSVANLDAEAEVASSRNFPSKKKYSKKGNEKHESSKKDSLIERDGTIEKALPGAKFKVKLENGHEVKASITGKIRRNYIKLLTGDKVKIKMSIYDLSIGCITYRYK